MNSIHLIIIIVMTFIGSSASLLLKLSTNQNTILDIMKSKYLYSGVFLYTVGALINIYLLKYLDYTLVLPFTSLTYVWTLFLARYLLQEKIYINKIIGISFIVFGCFLITQ